MADEILFEVNASEILVKLHLAAKQQANCQGDNFIVNTGIQDDNDSATPEKPGNVKFDTSAKTYQIGYVAELFEYKNLFYKDSIKQIYDAQKKIVDSKLDSTSKEYAEETQKIKQASEYLAAIASKKPEDITNGLEADIEKWKTEIEKSLEEINNAIEKDKNAKFDKVKTEAIKALDVYMQNFVGKENIAGGSVNEAQVGMMLVPNDIKDANDKRLVNKFEIQKISDQDKEALNNAFKELLSKEPSKDNCKERYCFNIQYSLEVNK